MIHYITGDATAPIDVDANAKVIAHVVNCQNVWGAGFVVPLGRKFPHAKARYEASFTEGHDGAPNYNLGDLQIAEIAYKKLYVANIFGQKYVGADEYGRAPIRYWAIERSFEKLYAWRREEDNPLEGCSIHVPRLGAGLSGGDFFRVLRAINNTYDLVENDLYVYTLPNELDKYINYSAEEL